MSKLSVVIPALNEEEGIAEVITRVLAVKDDLWLTAGITELEVLVVDDGSTDGTGAIVTRMAAGTRGEGASVRLIRHGANRGYGAALQTGFARARGAYLAFLDADGTYPPEMLPLLCCVARITGTGMALGDRMSSTSSQMPALRRLGNVLFACLASVLAGRRVHDCCSGMRVLHATTWQRLKPLPDGLDFSPAMTMRALHQQLGLEEVVIPYHERVGRSKLKIGRDGVCFLATILRETWMQRPARLWALAAPALALAAGLVAAVALAAAAPAGWGRLEISLLLGALTLAAALSLLGWSVSPRLRPADARSVWPLPLRQGGSVARREKEQVTR